MRLRRKKNNKQIYKYHVVAENTFFSQEEDGVYRNGEVYQDKIDPKTGNRLVRKLIRKNHAKVCYDTSHLDLVDLREKR